MARVILASVFLLCVVAAAPPSHAAEDVSAPPAPASVAARPPAGEEVPLTLDEVKALLDKGRTPRIRITGKFGSPVTGKALRIADSKIDIDVTAEQLGISGVLGVPTSNIKAIHALLALTEEQRRAAEKATSEYLASIRTAPPAESPQSAAEPSETSSAPEVQDSATPVEKVDYLAMYPPEDGWGPAKFTEITRKAVVIGLLPFGKDKTFLRDYDAWTAAYSQKREEQLQAKAAMEAAGETVPPDFRLLPELAAPKPLAGAPSETPGAPVGEGDDSMPVGAPSEPVGE